MELAHERWSGTRRCLRWDLDHLCGASLPAAAALTAAAAAAAAAATPVPIAATATAAARAAAAATPPGTPTPCAPVAASVAAGATSFDAASRDAGRRAPRSGELHCGRRRRRSFI